MRVISIPSLVAIVALVVTPISATAQQPDVAALLARIEQLEATVRALELRIAVLEEALAEAPALPVGQATELANWRQLRLKMKMDKVRELLGEPGYVQADDYQITWQIGGGIVYFDSDSRRVKGWHEPVQWPSDHTAPNAVRRE